MEDAKTSLFYMFADLIIFISMLSAIILFCTVWKSTNEEVRKQTDHNTTTTANLTETKYNGYYNGSKIQYGGEMTGKEVFAAILNATDATEVRLNNHNLASTNIGKLNYLQYARQIDSSQLMGLINMENNYLLYYAVDTDGNVIYVSYNLE